jgi:hypothetical protein
MEAMMKSNYAPLGWTFSDWYNMRARMAGNTADYAEARRRDLSGVVEDLSIAECYRRLLGMNDADRMFILDRLPDDDVRQLRDLMARTAVKPNDEEDDDRETVQKNDEEDDDRADGEDVDPDDEEDDGEKKGGEDDDRQLSALLRMTDAERLQALALMTDAECRRVSRRLAAEERFMFLFDQVGDTDRLIMLDAMTDEERWSTLGAMPDSDVQRLHDRMFK